MFNDTKKAFFILFYLKSNLIISNVTINKIHFQLQYFKK